MNLGVWNYGHSKEKLDPRRERQGDTAAGQQ